MSRAIDAIELKISIAYSNILEDGKSLDQIIDEQPTVEPQIVRCKDCKHQVKEWREDKRLKDNGYMVCGCDVVGDACGYWALLGQDDDYCSMAERKTDEKENI